MFANWSKSGGSNCTLVVEVNTAFAELEVPQVLPSESSSPYSPANSEFETIIEFEVSTALIVTLTTVSLTDIEYF